MRRGSAHPGKLACIEEADGKLRTISDASVSGVNYRIKPRDQHDYPGLPEQAAIMRWAQTGRGATASPPVSRYGVLKFDIKSAHRLVKKRPEDFRYLVMRLDNGEFWIHKVGAFGDSSASYW